MRWLVVTPTYSYEEVIDWEIGGPIMETADVIEIEAATKRDAIALGVKAMLADHRLFSYCHDQRQDGVCPYTGVWAEPAEAPGEALKGEEGR